MTVTDLADLFRHRREAAGLSKSEAARRNGTDRARIRNYEQGKKLQNIAAEGHPHLRRSGHGWGNRASEAVSTAETTLGNSGHASHTSPIAWGISWGIWRAIRNVDGHSMGTFRPEKTLWRPLGTVPILI